MPRSIAPLITSYRRSHRNLPGPARGGLPPVTFGPGNPLLINAFLALNADLTADPSTWLWTDITPYVRYNPGISVTTGRPDEGSTVNPGTGSLTLDNIDMRFGTKNPVGPYYGFLTRNTPIMVTINPGNGAYKVIEMFVNEWPPRWDKTSTDFTIPIQCSGIFNRLSQGSVSKSAIRRTVESDSTVVAYWPFEDGELSTVPESGFSGGSPMKFLTGFGVGLGSIGPGSVAFAKFNDLLGSGTTPNFNTTENSLTLIYNRFDSVLYGSIIGCTTPWRIEFFWNARGSYTDLDENAGPFIQLSCDNGSIHDGTQIFPGGNSLNAGFFPTGRMPTVVAGGANISEINDTNYNIWRHIAVTAEQSGGNVITKLYIDGILSGTSTDVGTLGSILGINIITLETGGPSTGGGVVGSGGDISFSHVFIGNGTTLTLGQPADGYDGESAANRIRRVCAEEGVSVVVADYPSAPLGPQSTGDLMTVLRDAEKGDGGTLYEHGFKVGYHPLSYRYNKPTAMIASYTAHELADTPEPTYDDQKLRNYWSITKTGGSTHIASDEDSIARDGLYDDSDTVNVSEESQAQHDAEWRVHLGIQDELRYPSVDFNFSNPEGVNLVAPWAQLEFGARARVDNLPIGITPNPADLIIEGKTETFNQYLWETNVNTSPAEVYNVFNMDIASHKIDTDGCELKEAISNSDTSFDIETTLGERWTTDASDFPFDVRIVGERITVTDIDPISLDTFTRTESNGWGTADSGGAWTSEGGAASDFSVGSGKGSHLLTSTNTTRRSSIGTDLSYAEVSVSIDVAVTPTGASIDGSLMLMYQDVSNLYHATIEVNTNDNVLLRIVRRVSAVNTTLISASTGITHVAGTYIRIKAMAQNSADGVTLRAKTWVPSIDVEPSDWLVTYVDESNSLAFGKVGCRSIRATGNTNVDPSVHFDDWEINNPQIVTAVRSINGVVKSHTIGSSMSLWTPYYIGL